MAGAQFTEYLMFRNNVFLTKSERSSATIGFSDTELDDIKHRATQPQTTSAPATAEAPMDLTQPTLPEQQLQQDADAPASRTMPDDALTPTDLPAEEESLSEEERSALTRLRELHAEGQGGRIPSLRHIPTSRLSGVVSFVNSTVMVRTGGRC